MSTFLASKEGIIAQKQFYHYHITLLLLGKGVVRTKSWKFHFLTLSLLGVVHSPWINIDSPKIVNNSLIYRLQCTEWQGHWQVIWSQGFNCSINYLILNDQSEENQKNLTNWVTRFGNNHVCIVGAVISSVGFLMASFVNTIPLLILFYGIVTGTERVWSFVCG